MSQNQKHSWLNMYNFALLPRWSPFGDFEFFGPLFFKVSIFSILGLRTRQKSVQPLYNVNPVYWQGPTSEGQSYSQYYCIETLITQSLFIEIAQVH